jgi:hypothetical protein
MWIETQNQATKRIKIPDIDESVTFSENGKAQVSKTVGEVLIQEVDTIVESGSDKEED